MSRAGFRASSPPSLKAPRFQRIAQSGIPDAWTVIYVSLKGDRWRFWTYGSRAEAEAHAAEMVTLLDDRSYMIAIAPAETVLAGPIRNSGQVNT